MAWTDILKYCLFGLGALILLLLITNIMLATKRGKDSDLVRRLMYILAFVAVIIAIIRSFALYSSTVVFADVLVLVCLIVAFIRSEHKPADLTEKDENKQ